MTVYCLFYNTAKRNRLADVIKSVFGCRVVTPGIIQRKWVKGDAFEVTHELLPGYMFLYSQEEFEDPELLAELDGVYRVLGTRQDGWQLQGSDRAFAEMLYRRGGILGIMQVRWSDGRLELAGELEQRLGAEIVKIDRRQRALLRFGFDGRPYMVWVGYDVVEDGKDDMLRARIAD